MLVKSIHSVSYGSENIENKHLTVAQDFKSKINNAILMLISGLI